MNARHVRLDVQHADVMFGARVGMRDVSLTVASGETVALLGPSGVGKTSLLRAIAGLDAFANGRVAVDGRDVSALAPEHRRVVYLHQTPTLFPHLSVIDNVGFPHEVRGMSRALARERARPLLSRVRMDAYATRMPASLSGGQRHRVALARALAADPAVLLLDEPFAALDPSLRDEVREAVFELLSGDLGDAAPPAVLLVTHDVDEAVSLAERVVVLLDGAIVQDARSHTLLRQPSTVGVARFLGVPNIIGGRTDSGGVFHSALGAVRSVGNSANDADDTVPGDAFLVARADAFTVDTNDSAFHAATGITDTERNAHSAATGSEIRDDAHGFRATVMAVRERIGGTVLVVRVGDIELHATPYGVVPVVGDDVFVRVNRSRAHIVGPTGSSRAALNDSSRDTHV